MSPRRSHAYRGSELDTSSSLLLSVPRGWEGTTASPPESDPRLCYVLLPDHGAERFPLLLSEFRELVMSVLPLIESALDATLRAIDGVSEHDTPCIVERPS